jgi:hypothetical protein
MSKRTRGGRAVRLTDPKSGQKFTVVAFIPKGVDADAYWKDRIAEHDAAAHTKYLDSMRNADGTKNPLKASKAAARGKK